MHISRLIQCFCVGLVLSFMLAGGPLIAQEKPPSPKVSIAAAYTQEVTEEAEFIGNGEAIDKVEIVARVSGFVEKVLIEDGGVVESGDVLFRIENESYAATLASRQADLGKAQATLDLAKIELGRKEELLSRGSAPESERDIARANELAAEAGVKSAQAAIRLAELELSYTEVTAPFSGRVGRISVSEGELVGPTTPPLVTLIKEAPIFVRFSLSEIQLGNILEAVDTDVSGLTDPKKTPDVYVILPSGTQLETPGRIVFLDNQISSSTGTITVLAEFDNTRKLILDGAFVHIRIAALQPTLSLLVPQASVQRDQRGDFVLVVNAQQMVEQRYVTTGAQVGTAIVIADGLQDGESVIVEGLQRVRPGVQVDAILSGQQEGQ